MSQPTTTRVLTEKDKAIKMKGEAMKAIRSADLEALKALQTQGYQLNYSNLCTAAYAFTRNVADPENIDHMKMLNYLWDQGARPNDLGTEFEIELGDHPTVWAVMSANVDAVQFFIDKKVPFSGSAGKHAFGQDSRDLRMVKLLVKIKAPVTDISVRSAVSMGRTDVLRYLIAQEVPFDLDKAIAEAWILIQIGLQPLIKYACLFDALEKKTDVLQTQNVSPEVLATAKTSLPGLYKAVAETALLCAYRPGCDNYYAWLWKLMHEKMNPGGVNPYCWA